MASKPRLGEKESKWKRGILAWKLLGAWDAALSSRLMEESKPFKDARGGAL